MCSDNDDPPRIYNAKTRRARTAHRCYECSRTIEPGETYEYVTALNDSWWTAKTCAHCVAGRRWLYDWCHTFMHGYVLEETVEHWEEWAVERTVAFGRLVVWINRKWRRPDGSLLPVATVERLAADALTATKAATHRGLRSA